MRRTIALCLTLPLLVACRNEADDDDVVAARPPVETAAVPFDPGPAAPRPPAPTDAPPPLIPEAERGETGARDLLLAFARALEHRRFDEAWAMLDRSDPAEWSRAAFRKRFSDLSNITVAVAGGTSEGACGSIYYTAPVSVTATDRAGRPVRYEGEAVLRRVNHIDGATTAQLRWHFDRLTLDWVH